MVELILGYWNSFYSWASDQPGFIQVAIGNGLFFIAAASVSLVLYLCVLIFLRIIYGIYDFFSSASLFFKIIILLLILGSVILWLYLVLK